MKELQRKKTVGNEIAGRVGGVGVSGIERITIAATGNSLRRIARVRKLAAIRWVSCVALAVMLETKNARCG